MKAMPSLTARALAMHNAVLRKAAQDHAGHVIEQEGDSWSLAFHDPADAVGFCMQAQQALQRVGSARMAAQAARRRPARGAACVRAAVAGSSMRPQREATCTRPMPRFEPRANQQVDWPLGLMGDNSNGFKLTSRHSNVTDKSGVASICRSGEPSNSRHGSHAAPGAIDSNSSGDDKQPPGVAPGCVCGEGRARSPSCGTRALTHVSPPSWQALQGLCPHPA